MKKERVILGEESIYNSDPHVTGLNRNVVAVGGAGTGKTDSVVKPELNETLQADEPMNRIVVVTKRTVPNMYIPQFKKKGFKVYDLNYADMESGNCADDPLAYIKTEEDIADTAHSIVMTNERKEKSHADPFWDEASEALLGAEIGLALYLDKHATFADVLDIHYRLKIEEVGAGIISSLDSLFRNMEKEKPDSYAVNCWRTFREAAPKTAKSIYVSMNPTLKAYTSSIRSCMKTKPVVDFNKFAHEKSILFITTSPVKKALHSLANIYVYRAITELFTIADKEPYGTLPIPVHITFDDFATGAKIADMPEMLSICREKNLSFTLLLQSEAQLEKMYDRTGSIEILDNCDSYAFFGGNNFETARMISWKVNLPLEEVLYMPVGQVIVFRRGQKPAITSRYDLYHDPFYIKVVREYERRQILHGRC